MSKRKWKPLVWRTNSIADFWLRVAIVEGDGCWEWLGSTLLSS
jgi:hypothetical protein